MAVFADAEEVYRYLAGIFRRGLENEDLANRLAGSGVVLRIHYTDPDAVLTVDMPEKVVETGADSGVTPNVELFMSADTGNRFWLGKVNLTESPWKSRRLGLLDFDQGLVGPLGIVER
ncbi:hypothetical protein, partial [Mycobacteroides abscessus]